MFRTSQCCSPLFFFLSSVFWPQFWPQWKSGQQRRRAPDVKCPPKSLDNGAKFVRKRYIQGAEPFYEPEGTRTGNSKNKTARFCDWEKAPVGLLIVSWRALFLEKRFGENYTHSGIRYWYAGRDTNLMRRLAGDSWIAPTKLCVFVSFMCQYNIW